MPLSKFRQLDTCALCQASAPLRRSHILPDFLYRQLRGSSGRFFSATHPHRAQQSGTVVSLLCDDCEQRFSRSERQVQRALFPKHTRPNLPIDYGRWMLEFAVSVSWRALTFLKYSEVGPYEPSSARLQRLLPPIPEAAHANADQALAAWRSYLLQESPDIDPYEQHLVCLNGGNVEFESSGVVGFTTYVVSDAVGVFSQLGPICLLGFIRNDIPEAWHRTCIAPGNGTLGTLSPRVPPSFRDWLDRYFKDLAACQGGEHVA